VTYIIQNALEPPVGLDLDVLNRLIDLKAIVDESKVHNVVADTRSSMEIEVLCRLFPLASIGLIRIVQAGG
jgi:hypothetical protein